MLLFYLSLIDGEENQSKFDMIYKSYSNSMLYTAKEILKDEFLAEDAVQEALLRIAQNIAIVRTDSLKETKAYVLTITKNCSLRILRKNSKYIIMPEENTIEETVADPVDYESKTISLSMYSSVKKALSLLNEKYLTPLVLQEQGYRISEISKILDISESAVKMRLSRAKRMIFEMVEAENE